MKYSKRKCLRKIFLLILRLRESGVKGLLHRLSLLGRQDLRKLLYVENGTQKPQRVTSTVEMCLPFSNRGGEMGRAKPTHNPHY